MPGGHGAAAYGLAQKKPMGQTKTLALGENVSTAADDADGEPDSMYEVDALCVLL